MTDGRFRVLHVDDDPVFVDLAALMLERESSELTVTTETCPRDALDRVAREQVDAVISDFDMLEMNGLEFLEEFRRIDPNTPFILYTGKGSEEIASKAISAGVTDYVQKGRGQEQYTVLANRVTNAISRNRAEKEATR
jgi:DNA-binding NtrC family response regulator